MPLSEIDPPAVPRPFGHEEAVSWREVCRAEFHSPRFACVHTSHIGSSSLRGTCLLCKRVIDAEAGTEQAYRKLKLILIGSDRVGKTSFVLQFVDGVNANTNAGAYFSTIGADFAAKRCRTTDGVEVKLQIWDTAGQPRFRDLTRTFYHGAAGLVVLFDVSRRETFEDIERSWWPEFAQHLERTAPRTKGLCACAVVLVGTRQDLTTARARAVTKLEAYRLAQRRWHEPY